MKHVILYGDRKDGQITRILQKHLEDSFTTHFFSESRLKTVGSGPAISLVETDCLHEISTKNSILLLKSNAKINYLRYVDKSTNVIVNADNEKSIALLAKYLPNVYTCGFSSKDFITFSSRNEGNAVVSLQRGLFIPVDAGGNLPESRKDAVFIEPFEIPCEIDGELKDYTILAGVLALILLGAVNENKCKETGRIYFSYQPPKRT